MSEASPGLLRRAILSALAPQDLQYLYFPALAARATDADVLLVTGIRGSGKSQIARTLQRLHGAKLAFDPSAPLEHWPRKDDLKQLLDQRYPPRLIWKTVLYRLAQLSLTPTSSEDVSVAWVAEHPRDVANLLAYFDRFIRQQQRLAFLLFDHFEQMADALPDRVALLRGALELMLELRPLAAVRLKAFVQPELLAEPYATAFPGGAKLLASQAWLHWEPHDLYALLYTHLGNASDGVAAAHFRQLTGGSWQEFGGRFHPPAELATSPPYQRAILAVLTARPAGPVILWDDFTQLTQSLTDALGRVSPQIFLHAVYMAAISAEHRNKDEWPLLIANQLAGLGNAARLAAQWLREELPWAHQAMKLLDGLDVPIAEEHVIQVWKRGGFVPPHAEAESRRPTETDWHAMVEQLQQVGALELLADGTIHVPQLYRLGFGLGRRGGYRQS